MKRTAHSTKSTDLFGSGKHGFTDGVPSVTPPTVLESTVMNSHQEEVARAIEDAGGAMDATNYRQLSQVLIGRAELNALIAAPALADIDGGGAHAWYGACSNALGRIVVVGEGGKIKYSDNLGASWTSATAGSAYAGTFFGVLWNGTNFVAWGATGEIQTDADGAGTWTRRNTGGVQILNMVVSITGHHIATRFGTQLYSDDAGVTWGTLTPIAAGSGQTVAVDGSIWVMGSSNQQEAHRSTDGLTFSVISLTSLLAAGEYVSDIRCLETGCGFVAGVFNAGSSTMQRIIGSVDGLTWTLLFDTANAGFRGFTRGRSAAVLIVNNTNTTVNGFTYGLSTGQHLFMLYRGDLSTVQFVQFNGGGCWVLTGNTATAGYASVSPVVPR